MTRTSLKDARECERASERASEKKKSAMKTTRGRERAWGER